MINVKMQTADVQQLSPKIAVIGVGGAGGNAVNNMIASNLDGCEFIVCNTDAQALGNSLAEDKVQLGVNVTGGLGAGSKPEIGQAAAEESLEDILRFLDGANMAFVTAGMGGGTGTGAAPIIAKACREQGILTVGVVTKPFHFEGVHRMDQAEKGIEEMQKYVDTLIVIPNQNLFRIANEKTTFAEAFKMADSVLQSGVRGVTDLMVRPGLVNLDFADIRTAMMQMGKAMMGTGEATGDKRAVEAAESAINNPLLDDVSMKGANGVIINVTGGYDMTLFEADEACNRIRDEVDPNANIIFGATFDDSMDGSMRVSIVATGIEKEEKAKVFGGGSGGGGVTKPISNNAGKVDRSMPNDVAAANKISSPIVGGSAQHVARDVASMSGREIIKGLSAPAPISQNSASPVSALKQDADESASIDMFEQGEFATEEENSTAPTPALRGSTYGDSFIPPKPMQPDVAIPKTGVGPHISNFRGAHAEGEKTPQMRSSGLQLNPPKAIRPSAAEAPAKQQRTLSLFERITGSVQQHIDNLRDDSDMVSSGVKAPVPSGKGSESPSQESLDINKPSKPAVKIDEELDIPAFLRRQAN